MGIILDQLKNADISSFQKKDITLEKIITDAIQVKGKLSTAPLGRIGQLSNQYKNKGLMNLIAAAKSAGRQVFNGINFLYLKLKN